MTRRFLTGVADRPCFHSSAFEGLWFESPGKWVFRVRRGQPSESTERVFSIRMHTQIHDRHFLINSQFTVIFTIFTMPMAVDPRDAHSAAASSRAALMPLHEQ